MYDRLMRVTAVLACLVCASASAVTLYFASVKTIVIAEDITAGAGQEQKADKALTFRDDGRADSYLCIPLPEGVRADDIVIENRYIDHRINILITGIGASFYEQEMLYGNTDQIMSGSFSESDGIVKLKFELDGLYEHNYIYENNKLNLEFVPPREMYDRIIVIDAAHGGEDHGCSSHEATEKQITLAIVELLRQKLEDSDIRAYYTRVDDTGPSIEKRAALANQARADMLISIHVNADETDTGAYGTLARYNAQYVIPGFGSVELADILERQVVTAIDGRAIGLEELQEQEILTYAEVPAASIEVGYLTNEADAALLEREEYRERIAEGIYRAILRAYEEIDKDKEGQQ